MVVAAVVAALVADAPLVEWPTLAVVEMLAEMSLASVEAEDAVKDALDPVRVAVASVDSGSEV